MRPLLLLVLLGACASPSSRHAADDVAVPDAPAGDAAPKVTTFVTCQDYNWTVVTQAGARDEHVIRRGLVASVVPTDDFVVSYCYPAGVDAVSRICPGGSTCTGSSGPVGRSCFSERSGQFVDGKLLVNCGEVVRRYDAGGALFATEGFYFEDVALTK